MLAARRRLRRLRTDRSYRSCPARRWPLRGLGLPCRSTGRIASFAHERVRTAPPGHLVVYQEPSHLCRNYLAQVLTPPREAAGMGPDDLHTVERPRRGSWRSARRATLRRAAPSREGRTSWDPTSTSFHSHQPLSCGETSWADDRSRGDPSHGEPAITPLQVAFRSSS
jgi:hypothetical protein